MIYEPKVLPILKWPEADGLHEVSVAVTEFDVGLQQFAYDMLVTMKASNGVGLAAPQVGVLKRLLIICIEDDKQIVLVNPELIEASKALFKWNEGCLSVPGYYENRERPERIAVKFQNLLGEPQDFEFRGLYAFAIQHEMDHLDGKLFVDGASELKRLRIKTKMKKAAKK